MTTCGCGQPVQDANLCAPCTRRLQTTLQAITGTRTSHGLAVDLDIALARQGSHATGPGQRGKGSEVMPFDDRASKAAWRLRGCLLGACTIVRQANPAASQFPAGIEPQARWLLMHIRSFRQLTDAYALAGTLRWAVAKAHDAVDPPDKVYGGPCAVCQRPVYLPPERDVVRCARGHEPWEAPLAERRQWMLGQLHARLAPAAEAVRMLSIVGVRIRPDQITRWVARDKLAAHPGPGRQPLYVLGEIIDLASTA